MMTISKKMISSFLVFIITLGVVACPMLSSTSLALESTGNSKMDAFINDYRWTDGASWGYRSPYLSSWSSVQCCAYVADFVKYCYGDDRPFRDQYEYHNANNIQAGDVIRMGSEGIYPYRTHYLVVLKRSGNSLYTAEGNWGERVRIGWNYTILDANRIDGISYKFADGAAYHYGTPVGGVSTSLPSKKFEPSNDYYACIIRPDVWKPLDLASNDNVQITTTTNDADPSRLWRFERQDDGSYAIFNQKNGYCLDASGAGTSNGTNVAAYHTYTGAKNQRWFLYDTGAGTVIKSANCDLVVDCSGGSTEGGTNIQLWEYNGTQAQRFNVYLAAKRCDLASESSEAYIIRQKPWLHLENSSGGNVQIAANGNDSMDPKQVWHFQKQPDTSYRFNTMYTSSDVSVFLTAKSGTSNGANVYTALSSAIDNVKNCHWFVYRYQPEYGGGLLLRVKGGEKVLTCNGGSSAAGTNIVVNSFNNTEGQRFEIWYLSQDGRTYTRPGNPNAPVLTAPSSAVAGQNISLSWTASPLKNVEFDTRSYRVEVLNGNYVVQQTNTTALSATIKIDTEGTYSIRVRAINTEYPGNSISTVSNAKTIVVSPAVKTLTSSMVSSVNDQEYTGSAITPEVSVMDGSTALTEGTDYTVAYSNNVNAGTALVTVTGKGKYAGTVTVKFNIVKTAHSITLVKNGNGTASISKTSACLGDEITVTATPDSGYVLYSISVNNKTITGNKFTMPAENVTVRVSFGKPLYSITYKCDVNKGNVVPLLSSAYEGQTVTLDIQTTSEYVIDTITVNGKAISTLSFEMPAEKVVVEVTFKKKETGNVSGKCSGSVSWTLDTKGVLTITGSGEFTGIDVGYRKFVKSVVFDGNITSIGNNAFDQCTNLKSITIPGTVKTIGSAAFCGCNRLESINIPKGVVTIKKDAFAKNYNISTITIPSSVKKIENGAFEDCYALNYVYYAGSENDWKSIDIGEGNTSLTRCPIRFGVPSYSIAVTTDGNGLVKLSKTTAEVGDEIIVNVTPATGYTLDTIKVNGTAIAGNRFTMPDKNTAVAVAFKKADYTLSVSKTGEGTAALSKTSANAGDEIIVNVTPATGYELGSIKVNGTPVSGNKFEMPAKDATVEVTFTKKAYAVSVSKAGEGKAALSKTSANAGDEITVTATPATGYKLGSIKVNGTTIDGSQFEMPAKDVTVEVTFTKAEYEVSVSKTGEGTVTVSGTVAKYGDEVTVTAVPSNGYVLGSIKVNGTSISGNRFEMPAKKAAVEVTFNKITYTIAVKKTGEGTVKLTKTTANSGDKITVTATPAEGYLISSIKVNGSEITGNKFTMPAKNTTVEVEFTEIVVSHELTKIPAKAATCTEDGNTAYYECKDADCGCGKIFSDKYGQNEIDIKDTVIPATGHHLEKVAAKEATCTAAGHLAYWKCSKCGKMFKDSEGKNEISAENVEVEALGHDKDNLKHVKAKKETYKEDGNIEYYVCPRCGKKFADTDCKKELTEAEIVIPKKGAAELGETATVDGFTYRVTDPSTDGTGTVTLTGVETGTASVVIPATVEIKESTYIVDRIAAKAFYKDTTVKTLCIGANVRYIDGSAFYGCKNLVKVSGGAKLEVIASSAFAYCSKLKTFVISSAVLRQIGSGAFNKDKKLKTVYIRNTVKLTKAGVKSSLKGSSVKTVKVKKAKVKAYKKLFKKSNSGKSVKVSK